MCRLERYEHDHCDLPASEQRVACYADGMSDDVAKELRYVGAQMEQVLSDVKAVHALVAAQPTLADFHRLEDKVDKLDGRMDVVEAAVKDVSTDVTELRQQSGYARPGQIEHSRRSAHG
jgi:uncharacterized protein YoxC